MIAALHLQYSQALPWVILVLAVLTLAARRLLWHLRIAFPQYACVIAIFFAARNRRLRFLVSKKLQDFSQTFTFSQAWARQPGCLAFASGVIG